MDQKTAVIEVVKYVAKYTLGTLGKFGSLVYGVHEAVKENPDISNLFSAGIVYLICTSYGEDALIQTMQLRNKKESRLEKKVEE